MSATTIFGKFIGRCENCDRLLYDHSTRYYVRFRRDSYCFCENCVTVIEPEKDGVTNDE